jgi:hypothetical protein
MEPAEAREAFEQYREQVKARHSEEDEQLMRGYKALAEGKSLLNLHDVMRTAGVDEKNRPKLAICRADAEWCWYENSGTRPAEFAIDRRTLQSCRYLSSKKVLLPVGTLPRCERRRTNGSQSWNETAVLRAMVPTVPPRLRPRAALLNYFTLWEAEWETVPVDPMLLKHITGPLYAVLATWDLTPLEQAVLGQRLLEAPR